ncbi:MAG: nitronate monooxygenase [Anaerolineae bacterium]|nr:nitronate monooxygenase [Anaerolineae bacterium]
MIELAPDHKIGLFLSNPVMVAAGCVGYGQAYRQLIDLSVFGAFVTNPITLRPRHGPSQPRLVETTAGFVLDTGAQNPGVKKVIREYGKIWHNFAVPVIAHLPAAEPDDLFRTVRALDTTDAVAAIELGIPFLATPRDIAAWVRAVREGCLLPVLVKLPLATALEIAEAAVRAAADALVLGSPPLGTALYQPTGKMVTGHLYGPALHSLVLRTLQIVGELVETPLIAAGGIHSLADAQAFLAAGAAAVQLDSLLWLEPKEAETIARHFIGAA